MKQIDRSRFRKKIDDYFMMNQDQIVALRSRPWLYLLIAKVMYMLANPKKERKRVALYQKNIKSPLLESLDTASYTLYCRKAATR